jgi:hypothetical protein
MDSGGDPSMNNNSNNNANNNNISNNNNDPQPLRPSSRPRSDRFSSGGKKARRRGRPAWMRSPTDSPLRDGNRDRLVGLLTER